MLALFYGGLPAGKIFIQLLERTCKAFLRILLTGQEGVYFCFRGIQGIPRQRHFCLSILLCQAKDVHDLQWPDIAERGTDDPAFFV